MIEFLRSGPFPYVFVFLSGVVFFRAQGTYWLGRWAAYLSVHHLRPVTGWRTRWVDWLNGEQVAQGTSTLQRWGLPIIPLSFLTVGFQSVVNAAAGVVQLPWVRYTFAMIPGCLAWALIYSTIGLAVWNSAASAFVGSPWGLAGLVALAAVGLATYHVRRRRSGQEGRSTALPYRRSRSA